MDLRTLVIKSLGVSRSDYTLKDETGKVVTIPLTSNFVRALKQKYKASPRPFSFERKLQNTLLRCLVEAGLFTAGMWIDIGGTREYGNWLGFDKERYDVFNLPGVENANLTGDIQRCNRPDLQRRYDGVISLNCLYMMQNPEAAINNMMKLV